LFLTGNNPTINYPYIINGNQTLGHREQGSSSIFGYSEQKKRSRSRCVGFDGSYFWHLRPSWSYRNPNTKRGIPFTID